MQKLKLGDDVIILAGKDKGKTGAILDLNFKQTKALIKGVNMIKKTMKPTQENPNGGFVDREAYVHMSNIALMSPKTKKATRVRIEVKDGKKVRVATACGGVL